MRIHYLQHAAFENLAAIEPWARTRGHRLSATRFHENESLPRMDVFDWLIVLGGPMNVYEEDKYSWLADEKRFIEKAVRQEKRVLGICLGAQLIATVLGAQVRRNPEREIGWHGDTFDLPTGAVHVARSEGCDHQAFVYTDRVAALQFHLETTCESVEKLISHGAGDMMEGKFVQKPDEMLTSDERFDEVHRVMEILLGQMERIGE
jgi:GMP synthase-like glutamine amidotransferase